MPLTTQNLRTILRAVPQQAWSSVAIDGTRLERRWITVLQHASPGGTTHRFGLLDDGTWSALYADGARVFPPGNRVPFLPLLESSWTDVQLRLICAIRALGVPTKVAWSFPLDEVVVLGLHSSEHWRAKAEHWLSSHYPLTDEMAALVPKHPRSLARYRERMASIFGADDTPLRGELEAADGSFLIKLRSELKWDKDAFNHLTKELHRYVRERDHGAPIPRWVAEGFWYVDSWVREWSSHESFPRPHGDAYYEAAYERLHALAFWLFTGSSMHEREDAYDPL